jgi:hypothetical protein
MSAPSPKAVPTLGYLTVLDAGELGLLGGYLLLNTVGRPLEFHCTVPVKANRTQEILYGPTLRPYVYGELIGQALLAKPKAEPLVVFTDLEACLAARDFSPAPVALLTEGPSERPAAVQTFRLGQFSAAVFARHASDESVIRERWKEHAESLDLAEPFGRIREALEEAQRSLRSAA